MVGFFSRERHGRRFVPADRFDQALGIAYRWFLDRVGQVAWVQYVTAPADLQWWRGDSSPPLITSGINDAGVVVLTLYRKFIALTVTDETLLPETLYELLLSEWASLTGQAVGDLDPEF